MGLDMGSSFVKGVLFCDDEEPRFHMEKSGINYRRTAAAVRDALLREAGVTAADCDLVLVTGCGANCVEFAGAAAAEMPCLIRAVAEAVRPCVVLDMGGQASRLGVVNREGRMESFDFSEKCASGSGKILESVARVLQLSFAELANVAQHSTQPTSFTTSCAVFAESEAITAVARGESAANIVGGFHHAIAKKLVAMLNRSGSKVRELPLVAAGGAALDGALISTLESMAGRTVTVLERPQHVVAFGAALSARDALSN
jgi:predicted CoA-substrate-specific enzyme activase